MDREALFELLLLPWMLSVVAFIALGIVTVVFVVKKNPKKKLAIALATTGAASLILLIAAEVIGPGPMFG